MTILAGDDYAKEVLTQFTNVLQQEAESGNLDESVQDNIYGERPLFILCYVQPSDISFSRHHLESAQGRQ